MKRSYAPVLLLLLIFSACDKRCHNYEGTWQSPGYEAYLNIERENDVYWVSVLGKKDHERIGKPILMYYSQGHLISGREAFRRIEYHAAKHVLTVDNDTTEWRKVTEKTEAFALTNN
jgi:hypothetical protein